MMSHVYPTCHHRMGQALNIDRYVSLPEGMRFRPNREGAGMNPETAATSRICES